MKPVIIGISRRGMVPGDTLIVAGVKITFVHHDVGIDPQEHSVPIFPRSRDMARRLAEIFRSLGYKAKQIGRTRRIKLFPRPPMIYKSESRLPFIPQFREP